MTAVWLRARAELRGRWRAWLALAVLIGLAGGAVLTAAVGARRTQSAYGRFVRSQEAMDFVVSPEGNRNLPALDQVERLPQVTDSARVFLVPARVTAPSGRSEAFPNVFPLVDPANRFGVTFNRMKILSGRAPNPERADEAAVSFGMANRLRVRVGDTLRADINAVDEDGNPTDRFVATVTLRVVATEASPGEFQSLVGQNIPAIHLTPAFYRAHRDVIPAINGSTAVRVRPGAGERFKAEIERRRLPVEIFLTLADQTRSVERSNRFQAIALWLIATLTAFTAVGVFGQALVRQTFLDSTEYPTLRALGMTGSDLVGVSLLRAAATAGVAAVVAVISAILGSPLTPTGLARIAEPNPGIWLDGWVLALGALATITMVLAVTAVPAWRAARVAGSALGTAEISGSEGLSRVGNALAGAGFPPTTITGVRMAVEPGRGRTAVPVRSTVFGITFGIVALVAAVTFSVSLSHLLVTPGLTGWNWDILTGPAVEHATERQVEQASAQLAADPAVATFSRGTGDVIEIRGQQVFTLAFDPGSGPVGPSVIDGRVPSAPDEILLGTQTLRKLGAHVGQTVQVRSVQSSDFSEAPGVSAPVRMRIVGRVAMPSLFFLFNQPGEGAALTVSGFRRIYPDTPADVFFVRLRPGIGEKAAISSLQRKGFFVLPRQQQADIANLRSVANVPIVLAGLLAAMAAAILVHTLVTSTRRRRRDLAILKTLGLVRRQIWATVAWEASTLACISLFLGIPSGIAVGRWTWHLFADTLGVVPAPIVPSIYLLVVLPAALVLANLIALLPGRIAARMKPAVVLRTE